MKRAMLWLLGVMTAVSLAACTPTTEKKTETSAVSAETDPDGNAAETSAAETESDEAPSNGVAADRPVDQDAPKLDVVSVYTVSDDKSGIEGTMDSVDTDSLNAQTLVDLLIKYGTLDEGTTILSYEAADPQSTQSFAGPGASSEDSHIIVLSDFIESAELDLSAVPGSGSDELTVRAIARTFIEDLNIETFTLKVNGTVVGDSLTELDVE